MCERDGVDADEIDEADADVALEDVEADVEDEQDESDAGSECVLLSWGAQMVPSEPSVGALDVVLGEMGERGSESESAELAPATSSSPAPLSEPAPMPARSSRRV